MINLKIAMNDGSVFNIRNMVCDTVEEFLKRGLSPYGYVQKWIEILPGALINTDNIVSVVEMSEVGEDVPDVEEIESDPQLESIQSDIDNVGQPAEKPEPMDMSLREAVVSDEPEEVVLPEDVPNEEA